MFAEKQKEQSLREAVESERDALQQKQKDLESKLAQQQQRVSDLQKQLAEGTTQSSSTDDAEWQRKLDDVVEDLRMVQHERDKAHSDLKAELKRAEALADEAVRAKAEATAFQNELLAMRDQSQQMDASVFKERAKLQAEVTALQRKIQNLTEENQKLDGLLEDLTLDKTQLQEEKEALEDKLEEAILDVETAHMEVEELKLELADAQADSQRLDSSPVDTEDATQALNIQNARLREALIRLREQSTVEKMELTRELRTAEKDAEAGRSILEETEKLRSLKSAMDEQIEDLKDMVEQGSAFEGMVEELSDRVLSLEEDNIALRSTIRELEEAADIAAEMEEVQNEEVKALNRDLEERETIVRNLEEAIKMQRRREEDFQRTMGNYRTTVDTLRQEKQALLELQQGGEGEKSSLMASSQKALARAAQLVADAAAMRKREGQAAIDRIDLHVSRILSNRMESLLPASVAAPEIAAIRGEMAATRVLGIAAESLNGITSSLSKTIKPGLPVTDDDVASAPSILDRSEEVKGEAANMVHQVEFSRLIIEASVMVKKLLVAGQWPEFLSTDESMELGSLLGSCIADLESCLFTVLTSLKEEGSLTMDRSNIVELRQAVMNAAQILQSEVSRDESPLVPLKWSVPGLSLLRDASLAKYACLGASAALSVVLHQPGSAPIPPGLAKLYNSLEHGSSQATNACLQLAAINTIDEASIVSLEATISEWKTNSDALLQSVHALVLAKGDLSSCEAIAATALTSMTQVMSLLRSSNYKAKEDESYHPLSPEAVNAWSAISQLVRSIRSVDGDADDINFMMRAHSVETQIDRAIANEPKLVTAESKVVNLEKVCLHPMYCPSIVESISPYCTSRCQLDQRKSQCRTLDSRSWSSCSRSPVRVHWLAREVPISNQPRSTTCLRRRTEWYVISHGRGRRFFCSNPFPAFRGHGCHAASGG